MNQDELEKLPPEVQEFLKVFENFSKLTYVVAGYMREECREKVNCIDRLSESAFWFKAYFDSTRTQGIAKAVIKEKSTGKIIGIKEYGTKKEDPN